MNLYFNFFNDKENKYFIMNGVNNGININLNKFNMKVYLSDLPFDYSEITDVKLYIERSSNNISLFNSYISGVIDSDTINFTNVILDEGEGTTTYKIRLQFFNGGVLFHDETESICTINLKTICDNFSVDIFDAVKINETYELQSFNDEEFKMKFKIKLDKAINSNSLMYNFLVSSNEEVKFSNDYRLLDFSDDYMETTLIAGNFKDNITYLHFSIKDQFGNILNDKFKITTKNGTLSLFEILNNELAIKHDQEFAVFYNCKNVKSVTPCISYNSNGNVLEKKSGKTIGLHDKRENVIALKLNDYFEIDEKFNNEIKLKFILNNDEKLASNEMLIFVDNNKPKISLANIKNGYQLITDEAKYYTVHGKLEDSSFFYVGNNQKKLDISIGKKMLYLFSKENIKYVSFNGEEEQVLKYSNFYIVESKGHEFEVYNAKNEKINDYEYINEFCGETEKAIYFIFDQLVFSKYELNIINRNNGLKIKGEEILPYVKKQVFTNFNNLFYLKVILDKSLLSGIEYKKFDIGIEGLQYSFLYKVNQNTCSGDLDNSKKINLNFDETRIIAIKSNDESIIRKCDKNKIVASKKTLVSDEVSFTAVTISKDEYVIADSNLIFFEDLYNLIEPTYVYAEPKLTANKLPTLYRNYSVKELDKNIYSFSLDIPIQAGINNYNLSFEDSNKFKSSIDFIIEKNKNNISAEIDDRYEGVFDKAITENGESLLTTNSENVIVKFVIKNESLADIKEDKYLVVKSKKTFKKQKISVEDNARVAYISFNNLDGLEEFSIFYNNESKKIGAFKLNYKESIILNCNSSFVSGSNTYFLKYNVDSFANISISYPNKKMFKCELIPNNIVSITRLDNKSFLEELELEITAYDKRHLYSSVVKTVKGIFYNDSVITNSKIDEKIYKDGIIATNSFDLELYTYHKNNIEYIKYYDVHELDINKRNKFAVFDKNKECYVIQDIVTPISPEDLKVAIKIAGTDLIINKTVINNKVKLLNDKNNFAFTYYIENHQLNLKLTNLMSTDYKFSKIEYFVDSEVLFTKSDIVFDRNNTSFICKVPLDKFSDIYNFSIRGFNIFGKVNLLKSNLINCNIFNDINASLYGFKEFCLLQKKDLHEVKLLADVGEKNIYLEVEDLFGEKNKFTSKDGVFDLDLKQGYYCFRLIYKKFNYKKVVNIYNVEVVEEKEKLIDYTTDYISFDKITEIIFRKYFNTSFEYLSPSLIHYCNDELVEILSPAYEGDNIRFNINKKVGKNRLIYKDEYTKFELSPFEYKETSNNNYKIFSIHTNNQTMFYSDEDSIYLNKVEELYLKTLGITELKISTKKIRNTITQKTSDYVTTTIFKEFIPCTLDFYVGDTIVKTINVEVDSNEPVRYPIFSQGLIDTQIERNKLRMVPKDKVNKDTYKIGFEYKVKHFLLNYSIGVAKLYNYKEFLDLPLGDKEEFILSLGTTTKSIDELKNKISSYFKGEAK